MTQVYNNSVFFFFHRDASEPFLTIISSSYKIIWRKLIGSVEVDLNDSERFLAALKSFHHIKVMDRFFLFSDAEHTEELNKLFFDHISSEYETYINKDVNKELIHRFFTIIIENSNHKNQVSVLDFGSGSGLSAQVHSADKAFISIILSGYEISSKMERLSTIAGLDMYNKKSFKRLANNSFDAIFGSFSFHFVNDENVYIDLWRKLKFGGLLLANFHKNIGRELALDFFTKNNADIVNLGDFKNGTIYLFKKNAAPLLAANQAINLITNECRVPIDAARLLEFLIKYSILPTYILNGKHFCLENDVKRILPFIQSIYYAEWVYGGVDLYEKVYVVKGSDIQIEFSKDKILSYENYNPAMVALILEAAGGTPDSRDVNFPIGNSLRLTLKTEKLKAIYDGAFHDKNRIESARGTIFANSASYMGSKKALRPFLLTSIKSRISAEYKTLDLMCGSGAVAGMLALDYETYVSDAMAFSKILAMVQGGGYSIKMAKTLFEKLKPHFVKNMDLLRSLYKEEIDQEDAIFHSRISKELKDRYAAFCGNVSYTDSAYFKRYKQKQSGFELPYELCTLAYSNMFFGLYQSMQLDSLRYAISQIFDQDDVAWALGALVATASGIGTTYAGHFAQPKFKNVSILNDNDFIRLIEQRSLSVFSEFEARLLAFAHESENPQLSKIVPIDGPWQRGLADFTRMAAGCKQFIYVDAPYTREEYSRYYHFLETLIDYQYYDLTGLGRIPNKKLGHRFGSSFFTRSVSNLYNQFVEIFSKILKSGAVCGWSYSNSAAAECAQIIHEVVNVTNCKVESFESPYQYKAQGGNMQKEIKEYIVFFYPSTN